jgi:phosphoglycolate phosphatase-like HAD superfamily hydrolase
VKRVIVLWDIDNTLLYTGGAGSLGMKRAFEELYGVPDAFAKVEFTGRTDTAIFRDAARACGVNEEQLDTEQTRFMARYIEHLAPALQEVEGRLMPGIGEVLAALDAEDGVAQGLGTGNFRAGGELKLHYYGIAGYFPGMPGGFGEDSESRDAVIAQAIARMSNGDRAVARVVVVGDTPHDVAAARANGAFALGVATGRSSASDLLGCGADAALDDLSDLEAALGLILG